MGAELDEPQAQGADLRRALNGVTERVLAHAGGGQDEAELVGVRALAGGADGCILCERSRSARTPTNPALPAGR